MKRIKQYALGLLGVAVLTAGLYACSNEDTNSTQNQEALNFTTKSDDFQGGVIATIKDGAAVLSYDEAQLKSELVTSGLFKSIESVELVYGYNPDNKKEESFLTVLGVEPVTGMSAAVVIDLIVDGGKGQILIPNPSDSPEAFSSNTCKGSNCKSCDFERSGFWGKIVGCKDCGGAGDPDKPAYCEHSRTSGPSPIEVAKLVLTLVALFM